MASTNGVRQRNCARINPSSPTKPDDKRLSKNPDFSMKDLRAIIPKELWERSYTKSFYWLFHDIALVVAMLYLAVTFLNEEYIPLTSVRALMWCLWWYLQGAFMTGIWVIAHECGHHGFTPNKWVNNVVGFVLHSMLLVPYFSWQYTHGQHHSRTNNLELDTVHLPRLKFAKSPEEFEAAPKKNLGPLQRLKRILTISVFGWPMYLLLDVTGPPGHDELSWVNHFNPFCEYFPRSMVNLVMISDIGLVAWIWCLYRIYRMVGALNVLFYYLIPYLIVNHWLVTITFLQHKDWNINRYAPSEWTWLRGAFGTIDRDYGVFLNYALHHISDSHVIHHLFSTMPHYNAVEATKFLRESPVFGRYYNESSEPWYSAMWNIIGRGTWMKEGEHIITMKCQK